MSEDVRKRYQKMKREFEMLSRTPEAQLQAKLFKSWMALSSIGYVKIGEDGQGYVWCPVHNKWETLQLECGLPVAEAIKILAKQIPEHAKEVKKARERIVKEMSGNEV